MIVSSGQQRASTTHKHVSILPHTALPSSLPHDFEQTPFAYSESLLVIHFKHSPVDTSIPNSLSLPFILPRNYKFVLQACESVLFCK